MSKFRLLAGMALLIAAAACGRNDNTVSDTAYGGTTTGVAPMTPSPSVGATTSMDTTSRDTTRRDTTRTP